MRPVLLGQGGRSVTSPGGPVFRGDITPFLDGTHDENPTYASGNVITVPDGLYTLGDASDAFSTVQISTGRGTKKYVKAETAGGVVVDLGYYGGTQLYISNDTNQLDMNLVVAGIEFRRGNITLNSVVDLTFFYCTHTFDRTAWWAQVTAAADRLGAGYNNLTARDRNPFGDSYFLYGPGTGTPKSGLTSAQWVSVANEMASIFGPVRLQGNNGASNRVGWVGCDIHGSPDDGLYASATWDLLVKGCRIWDVTEFHPQDNGDGISCDPGHPVFGSEEDLFHNDAIQLGSSGWRPTIVDSWLGGRIMWNSACHSSKTTASPTFGAGWEATFQRLWLGGRVSVSNAGRGYESGLFTKKISDVLPTWPGRANDAFTSLPGIVVANSVRADQSGTVDDVLHVATAGSPISYTLGVVGDYTGLVGRSTEATQSKPASIADVFDEEELRDDPNNPANIWRATAGNAYSDMLTLV